MIDSTWTAPHWRLEGQSLSKNRQCYQLKVLELNKIIVEGLPTYSFKYKHKFYSLKIIIIDKNAIQLIKNRTIQLKLTHI